MSVATRHLLQPPLKRSDFAFDLPKQLIAQTALESRSASRLLVLDGAKTDHRQFTELPSLLRAGDRLVFNNTQVIRARIHGHKSTGGQLELMLERVLPEGRVLAKIRASKSPRPGSSIMLHGVNKSGSEPNSEEQLQAEVLGRQDDLFELVASDADRSVYDFIQLHGEVPLPPYIERAADTTDTHRYQTVYASVPGAVAAPTAGLHFDESLFAALQQCRVETSHITLHVGAGTFQPMRVDDPADHIMHPERISIDAATVTEIADTRKQGGRIIAVGTTSVRTLEAVAAAHDGHLKPYTGETRLFLTPGSKFHVVDGMITNFHLPESTLLMLVSAFAGYDNTMAAYRLAIEERYRFFSYGDAMLVWPQPGVRL